MKSFWRKVNEVAENKSRREFNPELAGVYVRERDKVCDCYRFYDGKLIDVDGNVIREFEYKYLGLLHKNRYIAQRDYEEKSWGMFDKFGKKVWLKRNAIHHEIVIGGNKIITLGKTAHKYKGRLVEFDTIDEYDLKGKKLSSWSSWENLGDLKKHHKALTLDFPKIKFLPDLVKKKHLSPWGAKHDYYHFNSIAVIPKNKLEGKDKRFRSGNYLVSCRHGSIIFILDRDTKEVLWSVSQFDVKNNIEGQHAAQLLETGNVLIFDNGRYRGWSRIIELNPISLEIEWEYKSEDFFTSSQGYVQVLSNDNLLITESEKGHVFEITREGEVVWEFYNPVKQDVTNSKFPEHYGEHKWIYRMIAYDKNILKR